ncbi:MAG: DUF2007 domain-containing protein [Halanaerobiales bacterium]
MEYGENGFVFLTNVSEREIEYVKSLLDENNIFVLEKTPLSGSFLEIYMGMNRLGIDIYVANERWEEACEILQGNGFSIASTSDGEESNISGNVKKKSIKDFLFLCLILGGGLFILVFLIYNILL